MGWAKVVLDTLKKLVGMKPAKVLTSAPKPKGAIDTATIIEIGDAYGAKLQPIVNDLKQCVGYTQAVETASNGAYASLGSLAKVTAEEITATEAEIIQFPTMASSAEITAGSTVTEFTVAHSGVGAGLTSIARVAGPTILAALAGYGVGSEIGEWLRENDPDFWTDTVGKKLYEAGKTIGVDKVISFFNGDGFTSYDFETVDIVKKALIEKGVLEPKTSPKQVEYSRCTCKVDAFEHFGDLDNYVINTSVQGILNTGRQYETINIYARKSFKIAVQLLEVPESGDLRDYKGQFCAIAYITSPTSKTPWGTIGEPVTLSGMSKVSYVECSRRCLNNCAICSVTIGYGYDDDYCLKDFMDINGMTNDTFSYIVGPASFKGKPFINPACIEETILNILNDTDPNADKPKGEIQPLPEPKEIPGTDPSPTPEVRPKVYPLEVPAYTITSDEDFVPTTKPEIGTTVSPVTNPVTDPEPQVLPESIPDPNPLPEPAPSPAPQPTPNPTDPNTPTPDTSDVPPAVVPDLPVPSSALSRVFNPTQAQVNALGEYLWSADSITDILKMFQNPIDGIISLHMVYGVPLTSGSAEIKLGYLSTGVTAPLVSSQFIDIDCGTISVPLAQENALDYPPYTDVQIYLPFIGIEALNAYELVGSQLACKYRIDVYTGACIAQLIVTRGNMTAKLYEFSGNCAYQVPLTSGGFIEMIGRIATSTVTGAIAAGPSGAFAGAVTSAVHGNVQVNRSGSLAANAGILGSRKPYLIITRAVPYDARNYNKFYGYPINKTVYLKNCSGFTRVKEIILHTSANQEERDEIIKLLKNGVFI